ncbi:type II toxin-antitoxin system HicB family antitoxin [uncultured Tateyamaria sp.]|uniref:type II toxin-antitoxin system HicB family antitoxin n=1 Tax=uncultured Tateyamaria sp. TaxID=455651 RepID=UPI00262E099B|nr:type II toxin-antitoxin system HicB family antitoxin [uncultured Tateyamaria sp.]
MPKTVYKDTRLYPVVLHREGDVWGYHNPDFGGGGAATYVDALAQAQDLLDSAIGAYSEGGEEPPLPTEPDDIDADGGKVAWLPVIISNAAERVAITLPKSLLSQIDATTDNRSAFFTELARERLAQT